MKTSTLNRSMLSGESMALLAELKSLNEESERESANINNSMQSKQDELDILWQNFKITQKEEKSPGIYILAGFIAGALSMFLMTAMLSFTTFSNTDGSVSAPVQERKIVKKDHGSFAPIGSPQYVADQATVADLTAEEAVVNAPAVINDKYKVKAGDSLEAISVKFYGKASPENTKKLQAANGLASPHAIYAGQELLIPMN